MRWRSHHNEVVAGYMLFLFVGLNGKELHKRVLCENDDLYLDCAPKSFLAIHNASFTTDIVTENITCMDFDITKETCVQDIRMPLNRRCSGLNNCTYNFVDDQRDRRKCQAQGIVVIYYDCVRESWLHRFCNTQISSSEGYIMSPGYPLYYPALNDCSWNLEGGEGQTVLTTTLHVSITAPTQHYGRSVCSDFVAMVERGNKLFTACGESTDMLKTVESESNKLSVQFVAHQFTPASGFLLHFKLQGCSTPLPPENGYLVYRNGSTAVYMCCRGYYFNDTLDANRILHCNEHNRWNGTLQSCISIEELKETRNLTDILEEFFFPNTTEKEALVEPVVSSDTFVEDIVIPTVILVALLVGNAVILYIILLVRRKQRQKLKQGVQEEGEALNTTHITASPGAQATNV